jgi:hypothetical protein
MRMSDVEIWCCGIGGERIANLFAWTVEGGETGVLYE